MISMSLSRHYLMNLHVERHCDLHTERELYLNDPVITCSILLFCFFSCSPLIYVDNLYMEACVQRVSFFNCPIITWLWVGLQGPNQILYRLKIFFFLFFSKQNYIIVILFFCLYRKNKHSITIFKSNVIHHGYTVVAVLRGNHLIKEHGSKVGGLFTSLKAKEKTAQTKTIQNYTSHKLNQRSDRPWLASCFFFSFSFFDYALKLEKVKRSNWSGEIFISPAEPALSL